MDLAGEVSYVQHTAVKAHSEWGWRKQERQRLWSAAVTSAQNRPRLCTLATALSSASYRHSMRRKEKAKEKRKAEKNKMKQDKAKGKEDRRRSVFPSNFSLRQNMSRPSIIAFYSLVI